MLYFPLFAYSFCHVISRFVKPRGRCHVIINGCVGAITVLVFALVSTLCKYMAKAALQCNVKTKKGFGYQDIQCIVTLVKYLAIHRFFFAGQEKTESFQECTRQWPGCGIHVFSSLKFTCTI